MSGITDINKLEEQLYNISRSGVTTTKLICCLILKS